MSLAVDISSSRSRDRLRDALTELYAYTLVLDGELERTEKLAADLGHHDAEAEVLAELRQRSSDIALQLELLSRMTVALRTAADPAGRYL